MVTAVKRFEVWLVTLNPTKGSEIQKTRPCLVISPNEINNWLRTVIIAPMTTSERSYPSRVALKFQGKSGQVALDQLRTVDKLRLVKKLGKITPKVEERISQTLIEMFTL
ncbi:MAG: type II toxin-antitoxin system PemK/MazF family toxin [Emcibacter sp.]|nr:type II toxin-antitoxin system PemK/MazF family toxin [Emcibacter sp.]